MMASCAWSDYLDEMPEPNSQTPQNTENKAQERNAADTVVANNYNSRVNDNTFTYWEPVTFNIYNDIICYDIIDLKAKLMYKDQELWTLSNNHVYLRGEDVGTLGSEKDGSLADSQRSNPYKIKWTKDIAEDSLDEADRIILDFQIRCIDETEFTSRVMFEHEFYTDVLPNYKTWNLHIVPDGKGISLNENNIIVRLNLQAVEVDAHVNGWENPN